MDSLRGIGRDGVLPWRVPEDLSRFRQLTQGHIVVVGRTTFDKLPQLDGRTVAVVSKKFSAGDRLPKNAFGFKTFQEVHAHFRNDRGLLYVAGGAMLYQTTVQFWARLYLTEIVGSYECDTIMPVWEHRKHKLTSNRAFAAGRFKTYLFM